MLSREYLNSLSLDELKELAAKFGITPLGSFGKREAWIAAIIKAPLKAVEQLKDGVGLTAPDSNSYLLLTTVLDSIGRPTDAQLSLQKLTQSGFFFEKEEFHYYQLRLDELYNARMLLLQLLKLLAG